MPATPLITLTATFDDLTGTAVGSASNPSKLIIRLCNFGMYLPNITGTAMLAQIDQVVLSTTGSFSVSLWANDQIAPANTFYAITVEDAEGRPVQTGVYVLNASGSPTTVDLSSLSQVVPVVLLPPTAQQVSFKYTFEASGNTFNLPVAPAAGTVFMLWYNGNFQGFNDGTFYGIAGTTGTLNFTAEEGDTIYAVYYQS